MAPSTEEFHVNVVDRVTVQHPTTGAVLSLRAYLELDADLRSNDEAAVIDERFTRRLLEWLGYDEADWVYNRGDEGGGNYRRPDFVVKLAGATTFVVEDKNTTHDLEKADIEQLRRYTAGTQGYALWTNGRTILAFQFFPGGSYKVLLDIPVTVPELPFEEMENSIGLLKLLFERNRFARMPGILERISLPEDEWARRARPLSTDEAQHEFIRETSSLLGQLSLAARTQIDLAERDVAQARNDFGRVQQRISDELELMVRDIIPEERDAFRNTFSDIFASPGHVDETSLHVLKPRNLGPIASRSWDTITDRLLESVLDFRERESVRRDSAAIHDSFQIWKERYRIIEGGDSSIPPEQKEKRRRDAYADQVAYTFFIRLLLARTLEDKGIIRRLISDGGLERWRQVSQQDDFGLAEVPLHGQALLDVLFQSVSRYYQHFFNQPVFDWFTPDDFLLALTLERLSTFSFAEINRDILGFAYEAYVERAFRNQKGHFLTRPEIVDYILDESRYRGREIIGRRVLDLAAGSGSFLVQASRRLRAAIVSSQEDRRLTEEEKREHVALTFLDRIQSDFVGFEINPFSCYLAELNLFLQVLDDLVYLWRDRNQRIAIEEFSIFNTDSLVLSRYDMENGQGEWEEDGLHRDRAREIKLSGKGTFDYILMNPPYVNRAKEQNSMDLAAVPFYQSVFGGGDTNYYLAFLRLANYYVADGGTVGVIVPLSLAGDQSAGTIRRWLAAPEAGVAPNGLEQEWTLQSMTRFYSRTMLFPDVTQGVCVATWTRAQTPDPGPITVAGGWTILEARERRTRFDRRRVVATDPRSAGLPVQDLWFDAWPLIPESQYLDLWEQIRANSSTDLWSWCDNRLVFQQGDFNMTRTRPLRSVQAGGRVEEFKEPIRVAGSKDVEDFGPFYWSGILDAGADVESMRLPARAAADCEREREERLQRILRLEHSESVAVIRAIVGLESARPVRGALFSRGPGSEPFAFEHSLQILYPRTERASPIVDAAFGLLVSSVSNFVISLFSTNANISTNELKRLPIPQLSVQQTHHVGALAKTVQSRGEEFASLKARYSVKNAETLEPAPAAVLSSLDIQTEELSIAAMRGHLQFTGAGHRRVSALINRSELAAFADEPALQEAMLLLFSNCDERYGDCTRSLPAPTEAQVFLNEMTAARHRLGSARDRFLDALAELDVAVLVLYGVTSGEHRQLAGRGMPWASSQQRWAASIADRL